MKEKKCPLCSSETDKVIYYGLPHRLCTVENCSCLFGIFSHLTQYLPFNGMFAVYTGNYFAALVKWLLGDYKYDDE